MVQQVKVPATKTDYITSIPGPTYSKSLPASHCLPFPAHAHHTCAHTLYLDVLLLQKCPSSAPVAQ